MTRLPPKREAEIAEYKLVHGNRAAICRFVFKKLGTEIKKSSVAKGMVNVYQRKKFENINLEIFSKAVFEMIDNVHQ